MNTEQIQQSAAASNVLADELVTRLQGETIAVGAVALISAYMQVVAQEPENLHIAIHNLRGAAQALERLTPALITSIH